MASLALLALLLQVTTPEAFLSELCDPPPGRGLPAHWSSMASETAGRAADPELLEEVLGGVEALDVEPGSRTGLDVEGSTYTVTYATSVWTLASESGGTESITGETVVEWTGESYRWAGVPFLERSVPEGDAGDRDDTPLAGGRLVWGGAVTVLVLLGGVLAIAWVRKRYMD